MKIHRMSFDIVVSDSRKGDVYTLQDDVCKAIQKVPDVIGAAGLVENCLAVLTLDTSGLMARQIREGRPLQ